jgi:hypothetical protein
VATLQWADVVVVTADQVKQSILLDLEDVGYMATSWQPFSEQLLAVEIGAQFGADASATAVFLKTAFLSEAAQAEALTRLARSQYLNERVPSAPSTRMVTLTCVATEGPHSIDLNDIIIQHADGHTFRNEETEGVTYPATLSSGGSLTLLFQCDTPGAQSNVADQTVTTMLTTLAGVTITNDEIEEEGVDEESDDRLRARNSSKWSLLTRFETTDDAIEALGLLASPNITTVGTDNLNPRGVGTFDVYIAGSLTTASSADVNDMQAYLNRFVMHGSSRARAYAAPPSALDLVGTIYYSSGASAALVQAAVEDALEEFIKTIPLGGFDFSPGPNHIVAKNDIEAVIRGALVSDVAYVRTVVLTTPASDFAVSAWGKVIRGNWDGLVYTPTAG